MLSLIGVDNLAEFETRLSERLGAALLPGRHPGLPAQTGLYAAQSTGRSRCFIT